ncbi:hypothetical protein, partial [Moorena sp. SIO4G3]|uniref:hypothetical protein n=1 Tax=Moorena sp. SIO4G3 TaxID=2607821 RepID=UPI0025D88CB4
NFSVARIEFADREEYNSVGKLLFSAIFLINDPSKKWPIDIRIVRSHRFIHNRFDLKILISVP